MLSAKGDLHPELHSIQSLGLRSTLVIGADMPQLEDKHLEQNQLLEIRSEAFGTRKGPGQEAIIQISSSDQAINIDESYIELDVTIRDALGNPYTATNSAAATTMVVPDQNIACLLDQIRVDSGSKNISQQQNLRHWQAMKTYHTDNSKDDISNYSRHIFNREKSWRVSTANNDDYPFSGFAPVAAGNPSPGTIGDESSRLAVIREQHKLADLELSRDFYTYGVPAAGQATAKSGVTKTIPLRDIPFFSKIQAEHLFPLYVLDGGLRIYSRLAQPEQCLHRVATGDTTVAHGSIGDVTYSIDRIRLMASMTTQSSESVMMMLNKTLSTGVLIPFHELRGQQNNVSGTAISVNFSQSFSRLSAMFHMLVGQSAEARNSNPTS